MIDRALRDEGTSYHYLPPSAFSEADPTIVETALGAFAVTTYRGAAWTTDAPFREAEAAVTSRTALGLAAVELKARALYAFARA